MGWMVNATPLPLYPRERLGTHCIGGRVDPGPFWTGAEILSPTGLRSPDRPARSESLYRLSYPGPHSRCDIICIKMNFVCTKGVRSKVVIFSFTVYREASPVGRKRSLTRVGFISWHVCSAAGVTIPVLCYALSIVCLANAAFEICLCCHKVTGCYHDEGLSRT
jgi:hypothetical protein